MTAWISKLQRRQFCKIYAG